MCRYIGGLKAALNSPVSLLRSLVETQPPSTPLVKPSEIEVTCSLVKPCTLTVACPLSVLLRKLYMHCVETHKKCCCIPCMSQGRRLHVSAARPEDAVCSPLPTDEGASSQDAALPNGAGPHQQSGKEEQQPRVSLLDVAPQDWFGVLSEAQLAQQPTRLGKVQPDSTLFFHPFLHSLLLKPRWNCARVTSKSGLHYAC